MTKESDIMHEKGRYFVLRRAHEYSAVKTIGSVGIVDSSYDKTPDGLSLAVARCDYLHSRDETAASLSDLAGRQSGLGDEFQAAINSGRDGLYEN